MTEKTMQVKSSNKGRTEERLNPRGGETEKNPKYVEEVFIEKLQEVLAVCI